MKSLLREVKGFARKDYSFGPSPWGADVRESSRQYSSCVVFQYVVLWIFGGTGAVPFGNGVGHPSLPLGVVVLWLGR